MKISPAEISALTAAHDSDERCRIINSATEFILNTTGHRPADVEGLGKWISRAQAHLFALQRDKSIAKNAPALVSKIRVELGMAEAKQEKAIEAAAKVAPAVPKPMPAPARPAAAVVPVTSTPVTTAKPVPEPSEVSQIRLPNSASNLHRAKQIITDRAAQERLKGLSIEIEAIHSARRRYEAQLAQSGAIHSRHNSELKRRLEALSTQLISLIQQKSALRQSLLAPKP
ncbi:MAG: hypothetical protein V7641_2885 [Blastocatellia bacterium]